MVKNSSTNAGDMYLIPDPGKIPHATKQLSPSITELGEFAAAGVFLHESLCSTREATATSTRTTAGE